MLRWKNAAEVFLLKEGKAGDALYEREMSESRMKVRETDVQKS
jgi:hypothetical protein